MNPILYRINALAFISDIASLDAAFRLADVLLDVARTALNANVKSIAPNLF